MTYIIDSPEGFINAIGVNLASVDKSGEIKIGYNTEASIDRLTHLLDLLKDESLSLNIHVRCPSEQRNDREVGMFMDRLALFTNAGIYYAPQFRDMKDDFGITTSEEFAPKSEASSRSSTEASRRPLRRSKLRSRRIYKSSPRL